MPVGVATLARELGFHRVAIVPIEPARRIDAYRAWIAAGHAGDMTYLAAPDHVAGRADLRSLLPSARTLIVVALAYPRGHEPVPADRLTGKIARYARGEDYHLVMRDRLVALADRLARAISARRSRAGRASTRRRCSSARGPSAAASASSRRTRC